MCPVWKRKVPFMKKRDVSSSCMSWSKKKLKWWALHSHWSFFIPLYILWEDCFYILMQSPTLVGHRNAAVPSLLSQYKSLQVCCVLQLYEQHKYWNTSVKCNFGLYTEGVVSSTTQNLKQASNIRFVCIQACLYPEKPYNLRSLWFSSLQVCVCCKSPILWNREKSQVLSMINAPCWRCVICFRTKTHFRVVTSDL